MGRRRRSSSGSFSLFAFQDIITSVTGIMVLVTLLLALELLNRTEQSPASQTTAQLGSLEKMRQELATVEAELRAAMETFEDLPTTNPGKLKREISNLKREATRLEAENSGIRRKLQKRTEELATAKKSSSKSTKRDQRDEQELEKQIKIARAKLSELQAPDRKILVPGKTNKTTWLIEVTDVGFRVGKMGETKPPRRFSDEPSFLAWVQTLNPQSHSLYFVVKPKAARTHRNIQIALGKTRFDIGYEIALLVRNFFEDSTEL